MKHRRAQAQITGRVAAGSKGVTQPYNRRPPIGLLLIWAICLFGLVPLMAGAQSTYISTTFNESSASQSLNGTAPATDTGSATWSDPNGDWTYVSGGGVTSSTADLVNPVLINVGHADYSAVFTYPAPGAFLLLRYVDGNDFVYARTYSFGEIILFSEVDGASTQLANIWPTDASAPLTVALSGATGTISCGGVTATGTIPSTLLSGIQIGFFSPSAGFVMSGINVTGQVSTTPTTTVLSASSTNPTTGASVTLTATVSPAGATGTATFLDGATTLGAATLSGGVGAYTVTSITGGSHSYTAVYGGDANFNASTSSAVSVTASGGVSDGAYVSTTFNEYAGGHAVDATSPATDTGSATWSDPNGDWTYVSGGGVTSSTADLVNPVLINVGHADYSAVFTYPAPGAFLLFRYVDANNFVYARTYDGAIELFSEVAGASTTVAEIYTSNAAAQLTVNLSGSTATITCGGANSSGTIPSSLLSSTQMGFYSPSTGFVMSSIGVSAGLSTPVITWANPRSIGYGQVISNRQLDATASVSGTFVYSPLPGTLPVIGANTLSVVFTPDPGAGNYSTATASVILTVTQATPLIRWPAPAPIKYGVALSSAQLDAAATNQGAPVDGVFTYSPISTTVLSAGTHTLSTTFTPSEPTEYSSLTQTTTIIVNKATPVITWPTPSPVPPGTLLSGAQLDATSSLSDGTLAYTPALGTALSAGTNTLSVTFTPNPASSGNYNTATKSVALVAASTLPVYQFSITQPDGTTTGFAPNGNILAYSDSVNGTWSQIAYDGLNRLVSAQVTPVAGSTGMPYTHLCWGYDSFGNRTSQVLSNGAITGSGASCSPQSPTTAVWTGKNTVFTALNQVGHDVDPVSQANLGSPVVYDPTGSGDVIADGQTGAAPHSYLYDAEGRVCAVAGLPIAGVSLITEYLYDAEGNRVGKGTITQWSCNTDTNGFTLTNEYVVDQKGQQVTEIDGSSANGGSGNWIHTNAYAGSQLIATYDTAGSTTYVSPALHYQLADWLGTRRVQVSAAGAVEETCQGLPFGDQVATCALTSVATADDATEHHFTGKERDLESGNDYMFARYYNSATGRFLSPDWSVKTEPVPYAKLDNPQSMNLYGYVYNDPLGHSDPDGHAGCTVDWIASCSGLTADAAVQDNGPGLSIGGISGQQKDNIPARFVLGKHYAPKDWQRAQLGEGFQGQVWEYHLVNKEGQRLKSIDFSAKEVLAGDFTSGVLTGSQEKEKEHPMLDLAKGTFYDGVGLWDVPDKGYGEHQVDQGFIVKGGGAVYALSTEFRHDVVVNNGYVTPSVSTVIP